MKRYDPFAFEDDGIPLADMIEWENGKYVEYEDVRQKLEMFDELVASLRTARKAIKDGVRVRECYTIDQTIVRARALQEAGK